MVAGYRAYPCIFRKNYGECTYFITTRDDRVEIPPYKFTNTNIHYKLIGGKDYLRIDYSYDPRRKLPHKIYISATNLDVQLWGFIRFHLKDYVSLFTIPKEWGDDMRYLLEWVFESKNRKITEPKLTVQELNDIVEKVKRNNGKEIELVMEE